MPFEINADTSIKEVKIISARRFEDNRGFFEEIYRYEIGPLHLLFGQLSSGIYRNG